jgi:hypothetical protein
VGNTKWGKGRRSWQLQTVVFLLLVSAEKRYATSTEAGAAKPAKIFVEEPIDRLIGDNAYESDELDRELAQNRVEMIAAHRSSRKI